MSDANVQLSWGVGDPGRLTGEMHCGGLRLMDERGSWSWVDGLEDES